MMDDPDPLVPLYLTGIIGFVTICSLINEQIGYDLNLQLEFHFSMKFLPVLKADQELNLSGERYSDVHLVHEYAELQ